MSRFCDHILFTRNRVSEKYAMSKMGSVYFVCMYFLLFLLFVVVFLPW